VTDRPTKAHEYLFLLSKRARYYYDAESVSEPAMCAGETRVTTSKSFAGQATGRNVKPRGNAKIGSVVEISQFRNRRSVWTVASQPFSGAHFATFPCELIAPCILAGTSAKGCCPACGKPWKRQLATEKLTRMRPSEYTKRTGKEGTGNHCANTVAGVSSVTVGWTQECKCPAAEPVPCTILDPFSGAGTTCLEASRLGRHGIGIELNPEYIELARRRITEDSPLFNAV